MYHVINTMNPAVISSHRTLAAAEKAADKYRKAVRRQGGGSYLNLEVRHGDAAARLDEILRGF